MTPEAVQHLPAGNTPVVDNWAPASRDLVSELPTLVRQLRGDGFATSRVSFNLRDWDSTPRRTVIDGQVIRLGGFNTQARNTVTAMDDGLNRVTLTYT